MKRIKFGNMKGKVPPSGSLQHTHRHPSWGVQHSRKRVRRQTALDAMVLSEKDFHSGNLSVRLALCHQAPQYRIKCYHFYIRYLSMKHPALSSSAAAGILYHPALSSIQMS